MLLGLDPTLTLVSVKMTKSNSEFLHLGVLNTLCSLIYCADCAAIHGVGMQQSVVSTPFCLGIKERQPRADL